MVDTSSDYMRDKINALMKNKQDIKERKAAEQQNSRMVTGLNLYEEWFNTQNEDLKNKYNVASKWAELAWMIVDYWKSKWVTISWTDAEIINTYLKWNPEKSKMLYDYTHGDIDPDKFAIQMWWIEEPKKESSFLSNAVGWFYDAATSLPRMWAKWISNAIGWVAKQFWADEARVDELVNSYQNYLDSDWSSEAIGADKESWTYKASKFLWDMWVVATWEWLAKNAIKAWLWGYPLITSATPLWVKAWVWALEWAVDMGLYSLQADNKLPSVWDLALWAWIWVAAPMLWAAVKWVKKVTQKWATNLAEDILQNMNRMTKWEQAEFFRMTWETVGKHMNDRWLRTVEDSVNYWQKSKWTVDNALSQIEWTFTSPELTQALEWVFVDGKKRLGWVVEFTKNTLSPYADRMAELAAKNRNGWLTMSEINEVKRMFEKAYKFNYWMIEKNAEKMATATNLDNQLREWQFKTAEENWFDNLRELNKETQAAKYIADKAWKWEKWVEWNNLLSLTDWITIMWAWVSPKSISSLLSKKIFQTPTVKSKIVDMLNWVAWHENIAEKQATLKKIAELNSVKEVDRLYEELWAWNTQQKLEYKWMEAATDNANFTNMRDFDKPKPVAEVDLSKNNPRLVDKEVIENVPTTAKKTDARLDLWTNWEGLSKLRSKNADYMIVSAENFNWQAQSAGVNSKSTKSFREFLDEQWIAWKPQMWMYDNLERSQIIAIDNAEQRAIIDKWIEENAPQAENIIVKNWKAYRYDPRTNEAYYVDLKKADLDLPADATNYYSEVDGRKYQLPLYSEAEKPISVEEFLSVYNS